MTHEWRGAKGLTMPQIVLAALAYQLHGAKAGASAGDVR
jgi:hypothetical protein